MPLMTRRRRPVQVEEAVEEAVEVAEIRIMT